MVEITESAVEAINNYAQKKGIEKKLFRIALVGFGWGGPQLGLVQAGSEDENNLNQHTVEGIDMVWDEQVDKMINMYGKLVIDYTKGFMGGRLYVGFEGVSC